MPGWSGPSPIEPSEEQNCPGPSKVWVIERIRQYSGDGTIEFDDGELLDCEGLTKGERTVRFPGRPPFTICDIPSERAFLKSYQFAKVCRDESLIMGICEKHSTLGVGAQIIIPA